MNSDEWYDAHHPRYPQMERREHLDGEEVYDGKEFVGTLLHNGDGTYQIDSCREWGNLTSPNQPDRATAIQVLIDHAKKRRQADATPSTQRAIEASRKGQV